MAIDPVTGAVVGAGIGAIGDLINPEDQNPLTQGFTDQTSLIQRLLADPSFMEELLRGRSQMAALQGFDIAGGGGPQGLQIDQLIGGELDPETQTRLQEQAFSGFDMALEQAREAATGRASLAGLPGSSIEGQEFASLAEPMAVRRAMLNAQLQRDELSRREQLRERLFANSMAVQQSTLLQQLLGERIAGAGQKTEVTGETISGDPNEIAQFRQDQVAREAVGRVRSGSFSPEDRQLVSGRLMDMAARR